MSRIDEIIQSGQAPGYAGQHKDPQSADMAIPRALKILEKTHGAKKIAKDAGFSVNQLRSTWKI